MNEEKNYEEEKINVLEAGTVVRRPVPVVRNALDSEFYHHFIYSISFSVKYHHQCYFLCVIFVQSEIIYIQMHRDVVDVFDFFSSVFRCAGQKYSERQKKTHTQNLFSTNFWSNRQININGNSDPIVRWPLKQNVFVDVRFVLLKRKMFF